MLLSPFHLPLLLVIAAITAAQDIGISPSGDEQTKALASSMLLTCAAEGLDSPEIDPHLKWLDEAGNEIINEKGRVYLEHNGPQELKLYFSTIEESDAGTYTCQGRIDGNLIEKTIRLNLFKDITFDEVPEQQYPKIYSDALILCKVSGQPTPRVSWRYRNQKIQPGSLASPAGNHYILEQDGLRIINITEEDNGLYVCRAEVPEDARFDFRNVEVVVHIPPKITEGPGIQEGIEGHEFSLVCKASGLPSPKFEFYRENSDEPIQNSEHVQVDAEHGALNFRPVNNAHRGAYTCVAINDVGRDMMEGQLNVIVPAKVRELWDITGEEGNSATLTCVADGIPAPVMTFQKNGSPLEFEEGSNDQGRIMVQTVSDGRLEMYIDTLEPEDSSNYTCVASNSGGTSREIGMVIVEYVPRIYEADNVDVVYTWLSMVRNMTCHSHAVPEPLIQWYRFGQRLENNQTNKIYEMGRHSALQVRIREEDEGWIYGIYTCRAGNKMGSADYEIELRRARVPDKPEDVQVKEETPTLVVFTVTPPGEDGGNAITRYQVSYDSHTAEFTRDNTPANIQEEIRIESLQPSTTYIFKVRARNEIGFGEPIEYSHTTGAIRKPYSLDLLSSPVGQFPNEYTINWAKPRTGGIAIREYKFRMRRVEVTEGDDKPEAWIVEKPLDDWSESLSADDEEAPMLYYRLQYLQADTFYQLEVTAYNGIGWAQPHAEFIFKTAPGAGDPDRSVSRSGLSAGAVIGIVVIVFIIFLIIVDVSCYFMNSCGVLHCCCIQLCGKGAAGSKEKAMEEGERHNFKQEPPIEEARLAGEEQQQMEEPDESQELMRGKRKSAAPSENNERWKDVVMELEREISEKKPLKDGADDDEDEEGAEADRDAEPHQEEQIMQDEQEEPLKDEKAEDEKAALKDEIRNEEAGRENPQEQGEIKDAPAADATAKTPSDVEKPPTPPPVLGQ